MILIEMTRKIKDSEREIASSWRCYGNGELHVFDEVNCGHVSEDCVFYFGRGLVGDRVNKKLENI